MDTLIDELNATKTKMDSINKVLDSIQENNVEIAKYNSSITQLEKFNATLQSEIKHLENNQVENMQDNPAEKSSLPNDENNISNDLYDEIPF